MFQFPKMLQVFRDAAHQEQFERDGYIKLPFYNAEEIKKLKQLYHSLHPKDEHGFSPALFLKINITELPQILRYEGFVSVL